MRLIVGVLISCVFAATPAFGQVDLTGTWQRVGQNDNGNAREPVDLLGMPLSADGRTKALSYDIAALSATERQCQMYPPFYALVGPFPLQFVMVPDPVTQKLLAWKILGWGDRDAARRSAVSAQHETHGAALQEGTERHQMGPDPLFGEVVKPCGTFDWPS